MATTYTVIINDKDLFSVPAGNGIEAIKLALEQYERKYERTGGGAVSEIAVIRSYRP